MPTEEEKLVADAERQQRRQSQAAAESEKPSGAGEAIGGIVAKVSPTAAALQFAWRFYLPSFTLTSIYIVLHILLRYVFQFKLFCRADEGSPLGGVGKSAASAFGAGGGTSEKAWIALGLASGLPLAFACVLLYAIAYAMEHPLSTLYALLTGNL